MLDQGMWIAPRVNNAMTDRPHYRMRHAASPGRLASVHGIGTATRIECLEHEVLDLMTHDRIAQRLMFAVDGAPFVLVNTHLHHPPEATDDRVRQAGAHRRLARPRRPRPADRGARGLQLVRGGARRRLHEDPFSLGVRDRARQGAGLDMDNARSTSGTTHRTARSTTSTSRRISKCWMRRWPSTSRHRTTLICIRPTTSASGRSCGIRRTWFRREFRARSIFRAGPRRRIDHRIRARTRR